MPPEPAKAVCTQLRLASEHAVLGAGKPFPANVPGRIAVKSRR
jgi:hypothetical protein